MNPEKLREILLANGVDEETIKSVLADLDKEVDEVLDEKEKTEEVAKDPIEEIVEEVAEEGLEGDGKPADDVPPADETPVVEDDLPAGVTKKADDLGDVVPETTDPTVVDEPVPPVEENPVTESPAAEEVAAPQPDPDLLNKIDEQNKTIEGLLARIDSLEQALKSAGIIDGESEEVGVDKPRVTESGSVDTSDPFDEVLGDINKRSKRY